MRKTLAAVGVLALLASTSAWAGDATDTFTVSATVSVVCAVSAQDLDFGAYDPLSATATDAQTTMTVRCTQDFAPSITLVSDHSWNMVQGTNDLAYALYSNAAHSNLWNQDNAFNPGPVTLAGTDLTVYGEIAAGQAAPSGAYADTVTVHVAY
jgi:spore coat protein U-like protein